MPARTRPTPLASVRARLEAGEEILSPFAARSARSAGRARPEPPHEYRTEFQRDRDRIIHTNTFRRMKHKSQVFLAPQGDHYVTRLTHTIEVQQVGRTIARALNLNEDLVEAAALGHDLGHTPFGHIGEKVLDELLPGGFHHSSHSVRIVEKLEKGGAGLNLTREVVEGIRRHSKPQGEFLDADAVEGMTLEAQIVRISDAVAYLTHDIGDALRAGVITLEDLPSKAVDALGRRHSQRVDTLITDIIRSSWPASGQPPLLPESSSPLPSAGEGQGAVLSSSKGEGATKPPLPAGGGCPLAGAGEGEASGSATVQGDREPPIITMSPELGEITTRLRNYMFENVYLPLSESKEGRAAQEIVSLLFEHYRSNPDEIPADFRNPDETVERNAADVVCGMTDQYALSRAETIRPGISGNIFEGRL